MDTNITVDCASMTHDALNLSRNFFCRTSLCVSKRTMIVVRKIEKSMRRMHTTHSSILSPSHAGMFSTSHSLPAHILSETSIERCAKLRIRAVFEFLYYKSLTLTPRCCSVIVRWAWHIELTRLMRFTVWLVLILRCDSYMLFFRVHRFSP